MDVIPTIRTAPPPAARDFYLAYLNSPDWRRVRNRALKLAGWQCSRCPSKRELQVHHKTYERLGKERDEDLDVLCENCHRGEHLENPDQTSLGVYLKLASEAVRANPFGSIADLSETVKQRCVDLKVPLLYERIQSAIGVVCGNRLKNSAPQTSQEAVASSSPDRPLSHPEARELLMRLNTAGLDLSRLLRQMPAGKPSRVDIYGPVPREDAYEHDRY